MNWTKLAIASVIGGVVYFFLGWGIHGILLREATAMPEELRSVVEIPMEEFKMSYMVVSCLIYGGLLSFISMHWAKVSTFSGGLKVGAIVGVLVTLSVGLAMASMYKIAGLPQTLISTAGEAVCAGLAGGAIGWYLGR